MAKKKRRERDALDLLRGALANVPEGCVLIHIGGLHGVFADFKKKYPALFAPVHFAEHTLTPYSSSLESAVDSLSAAGLMGYAMVGEEYYTSVIEDGRYRPFSKIFRADKKLFAEDERQILAELGRAIGCRCGVRLG